jgi:hypothetical protein
MMKEQRKSFRFKPTPDRQACQLNVGTCKLSATLLDESAGGFAILVDRLAGLSVGQMAQVHTNMGWFNVRVIHLSEVSAVNVAELLDVAIVDPQEPWYRLGLSRLSDAPMPDLAAASFWSRRVQMPLARLCPSSGMMAVLGILFVVAGIALPVGLLSEYWREEQTKVKRLLQWSDRLIDSAKSDATRQDKLPSQSTKETSSGTTANDAESTDDGADSQSTASREQALKKIVRQWQGATVFTAPQIIEELQLTDNQQRQIHEIIEATSQAMRNLDARLHDEQRQQIGRLRTELLNRARREVVRLLTSEQRNRWNQLAAQP